MKVTIASPDKISLSLCTSYLKFCLGKEYHQGETHSLMTPEALKVYTEGCLKRSEKYIFSYYAKKKINAEPLKVVPEILINNSDLVIWMNLYSMDWVILKDTSNQAPYYYDRWKKNIEKFNF